jgi:hypothetical protein
MRVSGRRHHRSYSLCYEDEHLNRGQGNDAPSGGDFQPNFLSAERRGTNDSIPLLIRARLD